jgi:hypothetical protein
MSEPDAVLYLATSYPGTTVTVSTITYRYLLPEGFMFAVPGGFASNALEKLEILHLEDFTNLPGTRYIDVWAKPNVPEAQVTAAVNDALADSGGLVECCA